MSSETQLREINNSLPKPRVKPVVLATIKYLSPDETTKLLDTIKRIGTVRDYAMFQLAYNHGMRISEIGILQMEDFNPNNKRIFIRRVKGGISASYLMRQDEYKAVLRWAEIRGDVDGPLFPTRQSLVGLVDSKGISKSQVEYLFKRYCKKAKIPEDKHHVHVLRHSCAVHMVDKEIPMVQIQDWLGHKSPVSTAVYAKVSDFARDKTAKQFFTSEEELLHQQKEERSKVKIDFGKRMKG